MTDPVRVYVWTDQLGHGFEANVCTSHSELTFTRYMADRSEAIRAAVASFRKYQRHQRKARAMKPTNDPIAELAREMDAAHGLRFRRSLSEVVSRNFRVDNDNAVAATCGPVDIDGDGREVA